MSFTLKPSSIWSLEICSVGRSVCKVSDLKDVPSSYRDGNSVLIISNSSFYKWVGESSENGNWILSHTGKEKFYFFSLINKHEENQSSDKFEVYQIDPCQPAKRFIGDRCLSKGDLLIVSCEESCDLYSYDNGWELKCSLSD